MNHQTRPGDSKTPPSMPKALVRQMLWMAMLASVGMYIAIAFLLAPSMTPVAVPPLVFPALAIVAAFAGFVVHRRTTEVARPDPTRINPLEVVAWAFDESVAVLGLVATLLAASPTTFVAYGIVAAVLLIMHRPQA